jgi:superfamily II DNA or RNA helicase
MIQIHKTNESYVKVYSTIEVETEIRDYFTFKAPGYQFSPKYKARMWDGNISLYNIKTKLLPIGLYQRLCEFASENNIPIEFKECDRFRAVIEEDQVTVQEIKDFVTGLNLWSKNGPIDARDYQVDAIHRAVMKKRVTLLSPTSSGKSLILYATIRWILSEHPESRVLLIVPNVTLVNQMFGDFKEYASQSDWSVDVNCQKLYSGQNKDLSKRVLITTWQSFTKIASDKVIGPKVLSLYKAVIADEAHGAKGKEMQGILEKCVNAEYRIGATGTVNTSPDAQVNVLQIEGFLGPLHKVITTKELIDTKQVSGLKIKALVLKHDPADCALHRKTPYQDEVKWLVEHVGRNQFIVKVALSTEGTTLLLVRNRETHAKVLVEMLKAVSKRPVYYVAGDVDAEDRELIRQTANAEDCLIVGTFGTMATGVNIPNIRNVIFGSPSKSSITVLQSIGRGLRLHTDKSHMTLYDLIDDLRHKSRENYAYAHAIERLSIYRKEKFEIAIKEFKL